MLDDAVGAEAGRRVDRGRASGQSRDGGPVAARAGVQPAGQRQDDRGQPASRPRRPVLLPQRPGRAAHRRWGAGDQRGHQEEGARRPLPATAEPSGAPPGSPNRSRSTTSSTGNSARPTRTASTTWPRTPAGSAWAPTTTPPRSRSTPSVPGGTPPASHTYPGASRLLITADGGGSNGYRTRLWKTELAQLAAETGLKITVCHLPPGTSKWNKIEHRLFSHISMNWRGRPLTSHEVIVNAIAATTTRTGLTVHAELDPGTYPKGTKIPDRADQSPRNHRRPHPPRMARRVELHPVPRKRAC